MSVSFNVERRASIEAINAAAARDRRIFLVTQRDVMDEHPGREQLYDIGVICNLRQFVKKPEGGLHVMVEGLTRGRLLSMNAMSNRFRAEVQHIEESPAFAETSRQDARIRTAVELFRQYAEFV
jgi:ATP-dependent Lon protease